MNVPNSEVNTVEVPDEEKIEKIKAVKALRREEHGVRGACKAVGIPTSTRGRSSLDGQGT